MGLTASSPVGEAMATWAYRLLLDRDPESPEVLLNWAQADLRTLREGLLAAPEFAGRVAVGFAASAGEVAPPAAVTVALALRDGAWPDAAELADWAELAPDLDRLRREILAAPEVEERLPRRAGLRRRTLRLAGRAFALVGDSRDPEFAQAPGFAAALVAACRALRPDGGRGAVVVDSGAGIGMASLALSVGLPDRGRLLAFEEDLSRAALLVTNLRTSALPDTEARAVAAPDVARLVAEGGPGPSLIRLAAPDATGQALRAAGALRAASCDTLLRFDLRRVLLVDRLDPRAALHGLAEAFPGAAILSDPAAPRPLAGEAALDAALEAALDGPQEVVLAADPAWAARYSLA